MYVWKLFPRQCCTIVSYPYVNAYTCFLPVDDMTRRLDELEASMAGSANEAASATSAK